MSARAAGPGCAPRGSAVPQTPAHRPHWASMQPASARRAAGPAPAHEQLQRPCWRAAGASTSAPWWSPQRRSRACGRPTRPLRTGRAAASSRSACLLSSGRSSWPPRQLRRPACGSRAACRQPTWQCRQVRRPVHGSTRCGQRRAHARQQCQARIGEHGSVGRGTCQAIAYCWPATQLAKVMPLLMPGLRMSACHVQPTRLAACQQCCTLQQQKVTVRRTAALRCAACRPSGWHTQQDSSLSCPWLGSMCSSCPVPAHLLCAPGFCCMCPPAVCQAVAGCRSAGRQLQSMSGTLTHGPFPAQAQLLSSSLHVPGISYVPRPWSCSGHQQAVRRPWRSAVRSSWCTCVPGQRQTMQTGGLRRSHVTWP